MVLPISNPSKSYWIEAAQSPLRNYRSTSGLPQETDIVIVGSGYAGATAAYWIHKVCNCICMVIDLSVCMLTTPQYTENSPKQPKVTLLEARGICESATGRNGKNKLPLVELFLILNRRTIEATCLLSLLSMG